MKRTTTLLVAPMGLLLCATVVFSLAAIGCSFWESEGVTVGGRVVAEESSAGNLPDDKAIGNFGAKLQDEGDEEEDSIMTNLEGKNVPISDSDPLRTVVYVDEGSEQVLADDVVNLLPGHYDPALNPVEAEKIRAQQIQKQIDAEREELKKLDQPGHEKEDKSKAEGQSAKPSSTESEKDAER